MISRYPFNMRLIKIYMLFCLLGSCIQVQGDLKFRCSVCGATSHASAYHRSETEQSDTHYSEDTYVEDRYAKLHNKGVNLIRQMQYTEALQAFYLALKEKPGAPISWYCIGWIYMKLGQYENACKATLKAIHNGQSDHDTYNLLAYCYFSLELYQNAIDAYTEFVRLKSDSPEGYYKLGLSYYNMVVTDRQKLSLKDRWINLTWALSNFKVAVSLKPDYSESYRSIADVYRALGWLEVERGNIAKAKEAFKDAILNSPSSFKGRAHIDLGKLYYQEGNYSKAAKIFARSTQINPKNPRAFQLLANTLRLLKRYNKALNALKQASDLNPNDPELLTDYSRIYLDLGQTSKAVEILEHVHRIKPDYNVARSTLQKAYDIQISDIEIKMKECKKQLGNVGKGLSEYANSMDEWANITQDSKKDMYLEATNMVASLFIKGWKNRLDRQELIAKQQQEIIKRSLKELLERFKPKTIFKDLHKKIEEIYEIRNKKKLLERVDNLRNLVSALIDDKSEKEQIIENVMDLAEIITKDPRIKLLSFGYSAGKCNLAVAYAYTAGKISEKRVEQLLNLTEEELQIMFRISEKYIAMVNEVKTIKEKKRLL